MISFSKQNYKIYHKQDNLIQTTLHAVHIHLMYFIYVFHFIHFLKHLIDY